MYVRARRGPEHEVEATRCPTVQWPRVGGRGERCGYGLRCIKGGFISSVAPNPDFSHIPCTALLTVAPRGLTRGSHAVCGRVQYPTGAQQADSLQVSRTRAPGVAAGAPPATVRTPYTQHMLPHRIASSPARRTLRPLAESRAARCSRGSEHRQSTSSTERCCSTCQSILADVRRGTPGVM